MVHNVITLAELCEWWGITRNHALHRLMVSSNRMPIEYPDPIRKSGRVWLIDLNYAIALFGKPQNERPEYE